ncbi:MAG: hypothetical protein ABIJ09_03655 [Pseudomonadota bacterium]
MVALSTQAAQRLRQAGLEPSGLTQEGLRQLDANQDGQVDETEVGVALRVVDRDHNGVLDQGEQDSFSSLVEGPGSEAARRALLGQHVPYHTEQELQRLDSAQRQAGSALDRAGYALEAAERDASWGQEQTRRELRGDPEPSAPLEELRRQRAQLGDPAARARELDEAHATLAQGNKQLPELDQRITALNQRLKHFPRNLDDQVGTLRDHLATHDRLAALMPDRPSRTQRLADLTAQGKVLDTELTQLHRQRRSPERDARVQTLLAEKKALSTERQLANQFSPGLATQSRRFHADNLASAEKRQAVRNTLRDERGALAETRQRTQERMQHATGIVEHNPQDIAAAARLDRQIHAVEVRQDLARRVAQAQSGVRAASQHSTELARERAAAQRLDKLARLRETQAASAVGRLERTRSLTRQLEAEQQRLASNPTARAAAERLVKAQNVKRLAEQGALQASKVDLGKVDADIRAAEATLQRLQRPVEFAAAELGRQLEDTEVQATLEQLPTAERDAIEHAAHKALAQTNEGTKFFDAHIAPALEGKGKGYFQRLFTGSNKTANLSLQAMELWSSRIALKGGVEAYNLLRGGLSQALALRPQDIPVVEQALGILSSKGEKAARTFLARQAPELRKVADVLDRTATCFGSVAGAIAAVDLVQNPDLRNALAAASGSKDIAGVLSTLKVPGTAAYLKVIGKVARPLDAIVGGLDAYSAWKREDVGGVIGNGMTCAGGALATAGAICSSSIVGSPVGVPLMLVGGAVSGAGMLLDWIFGDSAEEKQSATWLQKHAPEYLD